MTEQQAMIRLDFIRCALIGGTKPEIIPNEDNVELMDNAIKALEDVQQYRAICTLEECMVAVEKQKPKKPTYDGDGYAPDGSFVWDEWLCPNCGSRFDLDYDEHDWCQNCGQKIDWSDV